MEREKFTPCELMGIRIISRNCVFLSRTGIPMSHDTCVSYFRFLAVTAGARTWQRTMPFLVLKASGTLYTSGCRAGLVNPKI